MLKKKTLLFLTSYSALQISYCLKLSINLDAKKEYLEYDSLFTDLFKKYTLLFREVLGSQHNLVESAKISHIFHVPTYASHPLLSTFSTRVVH